MADYTVEDPERVQCAKCGSFGWNGPTYQSWYGGCDIVSSSYFVPPQKHEALVWTCRTCGYQRLTPTCDAPKPAPPSPPPNIRFVTPGPFSRCFWFGHDPRWTTDGDWIVHRCRCGHDGEGQRRPKPPSPPIPPLWRNPNDPVRDF